MSESGETRLKNWRDWSSAMKPTWNAAKQLAVTTATVYRRGLVSDEKTSSLVEIITNNFKAVEECNSGSLDHLLEKEQAFEDALQQRPICGLNDARSTHISNFFSTVEKAFWVERTSVVKDAILKSAQDIWKLSRPDDVEYAFDWDDTTRTKDVLNDLLKHYAKKAPDGVAFGGIGEQLGGGDEKAGCIPVKGKIKLLGLFMWLSGVRPEKGDDKRSISICVGNLASTLETKRFHRGSMGHNELEECRGMVELKDFAEVVQYLSIWEIGVAELGKIARRENELQDAGDRRFSRIADMLKLHTTTSELLYQPNALKNIWQPTLMQRADKRSEVVAQTIQNNLIQMVADVCGLDMPPRIDEAETHMRRYIARQQTKQRKKKKP
eukprot:GHVS01029924.1.p1 GENE.GHVS01029924.1~~GHVS01029924.1.p1  ORF type:complete len:398 (-),score=54.02 GHVS01029924.1:14-1156(-)